MERCRLSKPLQLHVIAVAFLAVLGSSESFSRPKSFTSASPPPPPLLKRSMVDNDDRLSTLTVKTSKVQLSSGVSAEVVSCITPEARKSGKPALAFIHGSFHAAWCWTENYFEYFASRGYPVVALSLRGTGGTFAGEGVKKVKISEHVGDISAFLEYIEGLGLSGKPVVFAHSFGGLSVMKYLEKDNEAKRISGAAMLCSVPPSGIKKMTFRSLRRSPVDAFRITRGLAMKKCLSNASLCRRMFFGGNVIARDGTVDDMGVTDEDVSRYQAYFRRDTVATMDLGDLSRQLPSSNADENGRASFASKLPPILVVGAKDDFIVDAEGIEETGTFFGVIPVRVDSPHDIMLTKKWKNGADAILNWLENEVKASS